jgi:ADP-ribose pyrophosphatase YjhB (NUDIX family)
VDASDRVAQIAADLVGIARTGRHYTKGEYDLARYEQIESLANELLALVDPHPQIRHERRGVIGPHTPAIGVEAAIFEGDRLLLARRADSGAWCIPGGMADFGEPPSAVAVREAREETGLEIRPIRLTGVFDSRIFGTREGWHFYNLLFECEPIGGALTTSDETTELRWVTEPEAGTLALHPGHQHRVPVAFAAHRDPSMSVPFH